MVDFNRVVLAGNLTRDPEFKFTGNGVPVCGFGIAVNRVRSKNEEVDFFDVSAWRELGENIANYKQKGDPILIEGRLQFRQWESNDGERRSKVDVVADNVQFLGRGSGDNDNSGTSNGDTRQGSGSGSSGSAGSGSGRGAQDFGEEDFDDIPFAFRDQRRSIVADIL